MTFHFLGRDWQHYRLPRGRRATNGANGAHGGNGGNGGNGQNGNRRDRVWGENDRESLSLKTISGAFASLPRVLKLVWDVQPTFTIMLGALYLLQGLIPALTAYITGQTVQSVVVAFQHHGRGNSTTIVIWLVVAQFGLQGVQSLLTTLSNIVQQLLQEKTTADIQLMVMRKADTLDLTFFEDAKFYDALQEAQREAAYRPAGMIQQTFGLGRTVVTLFSLFFILVHLTWWLALLAMLAPIPVFFANVRYGWWGYQQMRRQSPLRREMQYYNNLVTTDTFNKEIKLFTLGDFFIGGYSRLADRFYREARGLVVPRYLASFGWGLASNVVNGMIFLYVALQAVAGIINLGQLTMFTSAAINLGSSFQNLLGAISTMYENNLFINTLFTFLDYQPRIVSPADGIKPVEGEGLSIEFRNVTFTYPGREEQGPALVDVSFSIPAGDTVALVGRNGAGKTTIVKLLTRLYDPQEGQILVNGRDIKEYDLAALRAQIGVIFQDYVTYYLSAARNIGVGRIERIDDRDGVRTAAGKSGADSVIERLPDGYESMLGKWFDAGQQLSGGEWQKVALARAFMRDAALLILDEPTSSLDPQAEYEVFARFRELTRGKSAIFISHRFSTVRLANRIIVLEHGRILEEGTHAALVAAEGRYAELFALQAEAYR